MTAGMDWLEVGAGRPGPCAVSSNRELSVGVAQSWTRRLETHRGPVL